MIVRRRRHAITRSITFGPRFDTSPAEAVVFNYKLSRSGGSIKGNVKRKQFSAELKPGENPSRHSAPSTSPPHSTSGPKTVSTVSEDLPVQKALMKLIPPNACKQPDAPMWC